MLNNVQLQSVYSVKGGTMFRRPEDLAWHPLAPRRLIIAQTDADQVRRPTQTVVGLSSLF